MYDITIIGGGPSGLQASANLAQAGLDVLVLEAKEEIGDYKVCTGIVSREAFSEFKLSLDSVYNQIQRVKVISPSYNEVSYTHPDPFAYVVDRKKFDGFLGKRALSQGVDVRTKHMVKDVSLKDDCVEVTAQIIDGSLHKYKARVVLLATGINYNLHNKADLGQPTEFLFGVQAEAKVKNVDCAHIFFGRDVSKGAFGWMVPLCSERARLGLMTEKNPEGCFDNLIENCCSLKSQTIETHAVHNKVIAQGLVSKTFSNRVLAIGEAAGQVKNTTGGGIYFGLVCANIASEVILKRMENQDFSAASLSEYEKLWKKKLQKEIILGYYSRKLCGKFSDSIIEKMIYVAQTDGVIPMIKKSANFDWHGELILALLRRMLI